MKITFDPEQQRLTIEHEDGRVETAEQIPERWKELTRCPISQVKTPYTNAFTKFKKLTGKKYTVLSDFYGVWRSPEYLELSLSLDDWHKFYVIIAQRFDALLAAERPDYSMSKGGEPTTVIPRILAPEKSPPGSDDESGHDPILETLNECRVYVEYYATRINSGDARYDFQGVKAAMAALPTQEDRIQFLEHVLEGNKQPVALTLRELEPRLNEQGGRKCELIAKYHHAFNHWERHHLQQLLYDYQREYPDRLKRDIEQGLPVQVRATSENVAQVVANSSLISEEVPQGMNGDGFGKIRVLSSMADMKRIFLAMKEARIVSGDRGATEKFVARAFFERSSAKDPRANWDATSIEGKSTSPEFTQYVKALLHFLKDNALDDVAQYLDRLRSNNH